MTVDFQQLRVKMVDGQVRTTDVTQVSLLAAMLSVPREEYVPEERRALAYIDEDIELAPAGEGAEARYLMEPSPFAKMVQVAEIRPGDRVLDVACGTGYSSAVLARLASEVIALESIATVAERAKSILEAQGVGNVEVVQGALAEGHCVKAPYDVIVINGSVDEVSKELFDQLAEGGRLVAVVGTGNAGRAAIYVKDDGHVSARTVFNAAVRPLAEFARTIAFEF
ncbi:protein-L-isoaspartate O-methyltransferase family protein [Aquamicrobium zhengzhouense]|uniref:Protein-L-isoaspartate O-methyltransferase n=1 Tax=Aquamicrobium zhengzhouense TaxID=2781738 RepID=A0ABS0SDB8_9HYPH|nr:protein-L-isoaspartate O-methyltransferase [Aquamicrobium zhengzhouense]MBI1620423.1 protein-L-isoaspartate O-methyltransferase [Aquamicrobium zhengzhouense]